MDGAGNVYFEVNVGGVVIGEWTGATGYFGLSYQAVLPTELALDGRIFDSGGGGNYGLATDPAGNLYFPVGNAIKEVVNAHVPVGGNHAAQARRAQVQLGGGRGGAVVGLAAGRDAGHRQRQRRDGLAPGQGANVRRHVVAAVSDSVVNWNGAALATTYVSFTQIQATVPATNLAVSYGIANITVLNPTNNSGTSNSEVFYLDAPGATAPTLTNPTSTSITAGAATLGGTVASDNGAIIQKRGILYAPTSTDPTPTLGDGIATEVDDPAATTGTFTDSATGLTPGTSYSFVAFATNDIGTAYTSPVSTFSTPSPGYSFTSVTNSTVTTATRRTYGSEFSTSVPLTIYALGMYAPGGSLTGSHSVGIWNTAGTTAGTRLASVAVSTTGFYFNNFLYRNLATPLSLAAGTYTIGAYYNLANLTLGSAAVGLTALPGVTFLNSAINAAASFSFPSTFPSGVNSYFGANFLAGASSQVSTTVAVASSTSGTSTTNVG